MRAIFTLIGLDGPLPLLLLPRYVWGKRGRNSTQGWGATVSRRFSLFRWWVMSRVKYILLLILHWQEKPCFSFVEL